MSEREHEQEEIDPSQERWLGAKWSSWGCLAVLGSLAFVALAIITVLYGIFTTPRAFGPPEGILSPDPALMLPFEPPPVAEELVGIPPVGVAEFTTRHPLRLNENVIFTVARVMHDWSPEPPRRPEIEYTVVDIRLANNGADQVQISPEHFRMVTAWEWEGEFRPLPDLPVVNRLAERTIMQGETMEATLIFARPDVRQVRRFLIYDPPFRPGTIRVLLVPG